MMVPQETSVSYDKTTHSVVFALRNPIVILQEPAILCNETTLSVAFGFRNHMMAPQKPRLFELSSTNLNTSEMLYHGSAGSYHPCGNTDSPI